MDLPNYNIEGRTDPSWTVESDWGFVWLEPQTMRKTSELYGVCTGVDKDKLGRVTPTKASK